jgi:hypothetical protein
MSPFEEQWVLVLQRPRQSSRSDAGHQPLQKGIVLREHRVMLLAILAEETCGNTDTRLVRLLGVPSSPTAG